MCTDDQRALVLQWLSTVDDLHAMFHNILDANHDGYVTRAEIEAAVQPSLAGWPEAAHLPEALMKFLDADGNGRLDIAEFTHLAAVRQDNAALRTQLQMPPAPLPNTMARGYAIDV